MFVHSCCSEPVIVACCLCDVVHVSRVRIMLQMDAHYFKVGNYLLFVILCAVLEAHVVVHVHCGRYCRYFLSLVNKLLHTLSWLIYTRTPLAITGMFILNTTCYFKHTILA